MEMGDVNMRYCVVKNTTIVIDGSDNQAEIMLQNALNAGFSENEVEILSEEEYQARVDAEPKPSQPPSVDERLEAAELAIINLMMEG